MYRLRLYELFHMWNCNRMIIVPHVEHMLPIRPQSGQSFDNQVVLQSSVVPLPQNRYLPRLRPTIAIAPRGHRQPYESQVE